MTPDDAGSMMRARDAHPYLARISDGAVANTEELTARIGPGGEGCFLAQVVRDALRVESRSPTQERAAQFQGVYKQLVSDALAWLEQAIEPVNHD